jgi:Ca2+:H+ antiporter
MVALMLSGGPDTATLPRDTLFATVMIIVNGVVGICLVVGGLRHHEQTFRIEGTGSAFAALVALSVLTLVLPTFTTTTPGPTYSPSQLIFASIASLAMWSVFIFGQTVRHRDYFLAPDDDTDHAPPPSVAASWVSAGLLLIALIGVVGLAKALSPAIERGISAIGAPKSAIGIAIALLVLLPEAWAAMRAARANRLQTSMNLALGSALATIGLTVPAVALAASLLGIPLSLGLGSKETVLLLTSFLVGAVTLGSGRTNLMQGAVHLVLFAAFLFLALVP